MMNWKVILCGWNFVYSMAPRTLLLNYLDLYRDQMFYNLSEIEIR